jgi:general secretion pathway protein F
VLYDVRALSASNTVVRLRLDAVDDRDARAQLQQRALKAIAIQPAGRVHAWRGLLKSGTSPARQRFALDLFSQELLALLEAGLSITEGLEALAEKEAQGATRQVLTRLLGALRDGKRLSAALAEQPAIFPPMYVGLMQAAEGTSDLPRALARYLAYRHNVDQVRSKVVNASIYPAILLGVGSLVTIFLVLFVVPRFASVYRGTGRSLPWLSQWLLEWGSFASAHAGWIAAAGLAGIAAFGWALRRHGRALLRGALLRIPGVGERLKVYELARLYLTLGMLLEGGIALVPAMAVAAGVVSPRMRPALQAASRQVQAGQPLSDAFGANGLATSIALRMLRVGERSGQLGAMLSRTAAFYDGDIGRFIERFTRSVEPLLMAAIGIVVGTIVVLLYLPIFELAGSF